METSSDVGYSLEWAEKEHDPYPARTGVDEFPPPSRLSLTR